MVAVMCPERAETQRPVIEPSRRGTGGGGPRRDADAREQRERER